MKPMPTPSMTPSGQVSMVGGPISALILCSSSICAGSARASEHASHLVIRAATQHIPWGHISIVWGPKSAPIVGSLSTCTGHAGQLQDDNGELHAGSRELCLAHCRSFRADHDCMAVADWALIECKIHSAEEHSLSLAVPGRLDASSHTDMNPLGH